MKPDEILKSVGQASYYHPSLSIITGSITSAVLLSHLLKWAVSGTGAGGWITKKTDEAELETGLGWIETQEAKNQLLIKGFIEQKDITDTDFSYRIISGSIKGKLGDTSAPGREQGKLKQVIKELTGDGLLLSSDMLGDVARATPYAEVDNAALEGFISLYGLSKVISTIDILALQYKEKPEPLSNPTMVLAKAFVKGVTPPDNHINYIERLKALKQKEAAQKKASQEVEKAKPKDDADKIMWSGMS